MKRLRVVNLFRYCGYQGKIEKLRNRYKWTKLSHFMPYDAKIYIVHDCRVYEFQNHLNHLFERFLWLTDLKLTDEDNNQFLTID